MSSFYLRVLPLYWSSSSGTIILHLIVPAFGCRQVEVPDARKIISDDGREGPKDNSMSGD